MAHHPTLLGAPRDLRPPLPGLGTPPLLLQRNDDDFVAATLEALASDSGRLGLRASLAAARDAQQVLKLFQPIQRQFHVAVIEAWCDLPGQPRIAPSRIDSAGLVVRRLAAGGEQGWMKSAGRLTGWQAVARLGTSARGEAGDPQPARRRVHRPLGGSVERALAALALEREDALLEEHSAPMFVAPPDVCTRAGKTLLYGIVPTSSSEVAATAPAPEEVLGNDFGADSQAFIQHLAAPLAGVAINFPLAGRTLHPGWFDASEMPGNPLPAGMPADDATQIAVSRTAVHDFITLLRQLAGEFDAFGAMPAAQALFARLQLIGLPLVLRSGQTQPDTVRAGDFLRAASRVLLERDTSAGSPEMPASWPALDAGTRQALRAALSAALLQRFADVKGPPGRFDDPGARYVLRSFVRLKAEGPCLPRTVWSEASEPFVIAPWYEGGGAPPVLVPLPDPKSLRSIKPGVSFAVPPSLQGLLSGDMKKLAEGDAQLDDSLKLGWLCSFSIPVITLCAFIVLNIFLSLFHLVFGWLFYIKICLPFPKRGP